MNLAAYFPYEFLVIDVNKTKQKMTQKKFNTYERAQEYIIKKIKEDGEKTHDFSIQLLRKVIN